MAVTPETIATFRNLPQTIEGLKRDILPAPSIPSALDAIALFETTQSPLPLRQQEVLSSGQRFFLEDRSGILEALESRQLPFITEKQAKQWKMDEEDITDISIHSASMTFALTDAAHEKIWNEIGRDVENIHPLGFTSPMFVLSFEGKSIRYSFRNAALSTEATAEHENEHVLYRYTHPDRVEDIPTHDILTASSKGAWETQNKSAFLHDLKYIADLNLSIYLDEQAASALTRTRVARQFIGPRSNYYKKTHQKRIEALRQGLPTELAERLEWERSIWEVEQDLVHKINFIDQEYIALERSDTPNETLTNTFHSLIPRQGYMVRLFTTPEATPSDVYAWAREYFNGGKPQTEDEIIDDWTAFLTDRYELKDAHNSGPLLGEVANNLENTKYALITPESKTLDHETAFSAHNFASKTIPGIVMTLQREMVGNMSEIVNDPYQLLQGQLADDEIAKIHGKLLRNSVTISEMFQQVVHMYHYEMILRFPIEQQDIFDENDSLRREYVAFTKNQLATLTKRKLELDDAASEVVEQMLREKEIDHTKIFAPGFKRSDEKYMRLLDFVSDETKGNTEGDSPYDDEFIDLFQMMIRHNIPNEYRGRKLRPSETYDIVSSGLLRLMLWSIAEGVDDERMLSVFDHLEDMVNKHTFPEAYYPLLVAETSHLPIKDDYTD